MLNRIAVILVVFYIGAALVVHAASTPTAGAEDANNPCEGSSQQYSCKWPEKKNGMQCLKGRQCKADQSKAVVGATCQGPTDCSDVQGKVTNEKGALVAPQLPGQSDSGGYIGSDISAPEATVQPDYSPDTAYPAPEGETISPAPEPGVDSAAQLDQIAQDQSALDQAATPLGDVPSGGTAQDIINTDHNGLNENFFVQGLTGDALNSPGGSMNADNQPQSLSSDSFGNSVQDGTGDATAAANCGAMCQLQNTMTNLEQQVSTLNQELGVLQPSNSAFPDNSTANMALAGYAAVTVDVVPTSYSSAYESGGTYDLTNGTVQGSNNFLDQVANGETPLVTQSVALPSNWTSIRYVDTTPH